MVGLPSTDIAGTIHCHAYEAGTLGRCRDLRVRDYSLHDVSSQPAR